MPSIVLSRKAAWLATAIGVVAIAIVPGLVYGIRRFYLEFPDADLMFPYWALLMNAGLPQGWYDHPAFFYVVLLAKWYAALDLLGLLTVSRFFDLPGRAEIEPVWAELVYAARILSLVQTAAFMALVLFGLRLFTPRLWLAAATTLLIAATPSLAIHMLVVRSELLSVGCLLAAFFALIAALQTRSLTQSGLFVALAGFAGFIAVETKVTSLVPLCALFLILPTFAETRRELVGDITCVDVTRWIVRIAALACILPLASEVVRLWEGARVYHFAVLGAFAVGLLALAWGHKPLISRFSTLCAWLAIGIGAGYLLNAISYEAGNVRAVIYVLDHVTKYTSVSETGDRTAVLMAAAFGSSAWLQMHLLWSWQTALIYTAALTALVATLAAGAIRAAFQIATLIALDLALAAIFSLRGSVMYKIYFYIWPAFAIVIGVETLLQRYRPNRSLMAVVGCLAVLIAACLQIGNLEPPLPPQETRSVCGQSHAYLHRIADYWDHYCPDAGGAPASGP
jgi:hypothetical protein